MTLFITGGAGFLGRTLLAQLAAGGHEARLLLRRPMPDLPKGMTAVTGDLCDPASYAEALAGVTTVVHMAAITGKTAPDDYMRINTESTRALTAAAKAAGVQNILFVSTIAAGYPDQRFYPYARSKLAAEEIVAASGLSYTILRPTLVLGDGSPIWDTLSKIAGAPVIPLPQRRTPVAVQPVDVTDVARGIVTVIAAERFSGETFDLGGRDALAFGDFLALMAETAKGKRPRILPVPLRPIQFLLAAIEPALRKFMPATAGQLAVFGNDSTVRPNWLMDQLLAEMPTTAALVGRLSASPKTPGGGAGMQATAGADTELARDADRMSRYLTGDPASAGIARHFQAACVAHGLHTTGTAFDRATFWLARKGGLTMRIADAFGGLFDRSGLLRRRLVLMTALLEHAPDTARHYDDVPTGGPLGAVLRLTGAGIGGVLALLAGAVILLPLRLLRRGS